MAVEGLRAATESEPEGDDARRGATRSAAAAGATPPRSARATKPRGSLRRRVETRGARVGMGAAREQVVGAAVAGGGAADRRAGAARGARDPDRGCAAASEGMGDGPGPARGAADHRRAARTAARA